MRRFVSLLLAVLLIASLSLTAFADGGTLTERGESKYEGSASTGSVNTQLWLEVNAEGQINVTVPLVLLFSTNINGGDAVSPSTYKITNNSTVDLALNSIAVDVIAKGDDNPMTIKSYDTTTLGVDEYKAQLTIDGKNFDLSDGSQGGQGVKLAKGTGTAGTPTAVSVAMETGDLSFITAANMGVKLLTVTYTVQIDNTTGIGDTIPG